jgi:hypothetical protein
MKSAASWIFVGTFGRVLECWDRETREYVAIKVVRSIRKYRDAAMIEIDVQITVSVSENVLKYNPIPISDLTVPLQLPAVSKFRDGLTIVIIYAL